MGGSVSQFCYLGPSLNFRECRNLCLKIRKKLSVFLHKIRNRA